MWKQDDAEIFLRGRPRRTGIANPDPLGDVLAKLRMEEQNDVALIMKREIVGVPLFDRDQPASQDPKREL